MIRRGLTSKGSERIGLVAVWQRPIFAQPVGWR